MKQLMLVLTLCVSSLGAASTPTPVLPRIDGHCDAAQHRQFDFWLGDWDVYDKAGTLQGHNLVTREYGNCVIREQWSSVDQLGSSFSAYDFRTKQWHHSWFDTMGNLLQLDGGLAQIPGGEAMVMRGDRITPDGKMALERTTWTPDMHGAVHQVWDYSLDDGTTWVVRFEGFYRRASHAALTH